MLTKREILFRAWDEKQRRMRYDVTGMEAGGTQGDKIEGIFLDGVYYNISETDTAHPKAIPMQYIGVKDINGKKVFEGDIVRIDDLEMTGGKTDLIGEVWYDVTSFVVSNHKAGLQVTPHECFRFEILGNCWDNPELLEQVEAQK